MTSSLAVGIPRQSYLAISPNSDTTPLNEHIQLNLRNWTGSDVAAEGLGLGKNCYVRCDNQATIPVEWLVNTCGNDGETMQLDEHS